MNDPNENRNNYPDNGQSDPNSLWQQGGQGYSSQPQNGQTGDPFSPYGQPQGGQSYQQPYQTQGYQQNQAPDYQNPQYQAPEYQAAPQQYQAYPQYGAQEPSGSSGMAVASMVCGILSLVLCCTMWISWILSIVALVLGIVSISRHTPGKGMAIAGIVTAAFAILLSIGFLVLMFSIDAANSAMDYSFYNELF